MTSQIAKSKEKRYVYPVALEAEEIEALEVIVYKTNCTKAEAIKKAIVHYADYVKGLEVMKVRNIPRKRAKEEIIKYLEKADRAWSSEIADELRLDITLVNEVLQELWSERRVEPTSK
ncbi:MAG: winged helix-turn-helix domain-containing protein [Candidatus Bathyarchaeia archaeon]